MVSVRLRAVRIRYTENVVTKQWRRFPVLCKENLLRRRSYIERYEMETEIFIIYDNNQGRPYIKPSWGFASIVRTTEKTILFDTGGDSHILLENMRRMRLDPAEIDMVIISHLDEDHVGGLSGLLKVNSRLDIYLPYQSNRLDAVMKDYGRRIVLVRDFEKISQRILIAAKAEALSLVVDVEDGLIILASRVPNRVLEMVQKVKNLRKKEIYFLIAAFCFFSPTNIENLVDSFKKVGVRKIAPCHCCEESCRGAFRKRYGGNCISIGVGSVITLTG